MASKNVGSKVDLSSLTSFSGGSLTVTTQGTISAAALTTLNGVAVSLDSTGTLAIAQWSTLTKGSLTITAGSYSFAGLTDIDGSSLLTQAGASLKLPNLATYTDANQSASTTLEATGTGSLLSLPHLTSITASGEVSTANIEALSGGDVEIPAVTQLNSTQATSSVAVTSKNAGSTVDLSSLTSFNGGSLSVTGQGTVQAAALTKLNNVVVTLDSTGTLAIAQWATFTNGSLTTAGGSYAFADLTDIDGSNVIRDQCESNFPESGQLHRGDRVQEQHARGERLRKPVIAAEPHLDRRDRPGLRDDL